MISIKKLKLNPKKAKPRTGDKQINLCLSERKVFQGTFELYIFSQIYSKEKKILTLRAGFTDNHNIDMKILKLVHVILYDKVMLT